MAGTANAPLNSPVKAQGHYSFVAVIPDDDVYVFTAPASIGHILVASGDLTGHVLAWYRQSSGSPAISIGYTASNTNVSTSALTGTTGTDGKLTISSNGGFLYIENRLGSSQNVTVTLFTSLIATA